MGIWNLFYVDLFLTVIQLSQTSFFIGQITFAIWNAVNDPLFGWMIDSVKVGDRRLPAIAYGGNYL
jgi:Na+/melibiose symporter-like transporter